MDSYEWIDGGYQLKKDNTFQLSEECEVMTDFEEMWGSRITKSFQASVLFMRKLKCELIPA